MFSSLILTKFMSQDWTTRRRGTGVWLLKFYLWEVMSRIIQKPVMRFSSSSFLWKNSELSQGTEILQASIFPKSDLRNPYSLIEREKKENTHMLFSWLWKSLNAICLGSCFCHFLRGTAWDRKLFYISQKIWRKRERIEGSPGQERKILRLMIDATQMLLHTLCNL